MKKHNKLYVHATINLVTNIPKPTTMLKMAIVRTLTESRKLGTVPLTYGDIKLKPPTYVNEPCLRMTVQESKHTARDNGNKGYSCVDKKFAGFVCS